MILLSIVHLALAVIAVTGVLTLVFQRELARQIDSASKSALDHIRSTSDFVVERNVQFLVVGQFYDVYQDETVRRFLGSSETPSTGTILAVHRRLQEMAAQTSFVHSIYLYSAASDILISSREGVVYSTLSGPSERSTTVRFDLLRGTLAAGRTGMWAPPNEIDTVGDTAAVMSFGRRLPLFDEKATVGAVVVNIDERAFLGRLFQIARFDFGDFYIVDSAGQVLSRTVVAAGGLRTSYEEAITSILPKLATQPEGTTVLSGDEYRLRVSWVTSTFTNWHYVAVAPVHQVNRTLVLTRQLAVAFALGLIIILTAVVLYLDFRLYRPVKELVSSVRSTFGAEEGNESEVEILESVVRRLSHRVEVTEEVVRSNRELIRHAVIDDILRGSERISRSSVNDRLSTVDMRLRLPLHTVVVCEFRKSAFLALPAQTRESHLLGVVDLMRTALGESIFVGSITVYPNLVATYVNFSEFSRLRMVLEGVRRVLVERLGTELNVVIGRPTSDVAAVRERYSEARDALQYAYLLGWNEILECSTLAAVEAESVQPGPALFQLLSDSVRAHRWNAAHAAIGKIFARLHDGRTCVADARAAVDRLFALLWREAQAQRLSVENEDIRGIESLESIDLVAERAAIFVDRLATAVDRRNGSLQDAVTARMRTFIEGHIDSTLSLSVVADEFGMSPDYLSKVFKRSFGVGFSDFVFEEKMKKAKLLLTEEPTRNVADIGRSLGYARASYFIGVFKKRFGITPARYRKLELVDG